MKLRPVATLALSAYLSFFLGWVVPHHACEHLMQGGHSSVTQLAQTTSHTSHNPDDCQLCRSQGQIDSGICSPTIAYAPISLGTLTDTDQSAPQSLFLTHRTPRAPPVTA